MPKKQYLHGSTYLDRKGNWCFRYRLPDGQDSKKKLGPAWKHRGTCPAGFWTERAARSELNKLLAKYEGFTMGSDPMFRYAAEEFLAWCTGERDLRKTTTKEYERIIRTNLAPLSEKLLSKITEDDVADLRADLYSRVSASSLNQTKIVFAGVIKYAKKSRKYRGDDPSEFFDRAPIKQKTHIDVYSPAEVELLARTVRSGAHRKQNLIRQLSEAETLERARNDNQDAVIYKTAAYAGLRMSEIRALRWAHIDFAGSKITIQRGYTDAGEEDDPKSGKARTVPMAARLAAELDGLSRREHFTAPTDLVFCNAVGEFLDGSSLYHRYVAVAKAAGLRRLTFHSLRHSFCSMAVQMFPLTDVQAYAGHAQISTTLKYVHFIPQTKAALRMDELIEANLGGEIVRCAVESSFLT